MSRRADCESELHIHVKYGEEEGVHQIPDGYLPEGYLPANKEKLVQAWIEIHKKI